MSIALGGIIAFFFRGLNLVLALATAVVTSHYLGGTEGRGIFILGATAVGIVSAMTGGITAAAAYQVSNQRRQPGTVLANGGAIAAALGMLAVFAGIAGAQLLRGEYADIALAVAASSAAVILLSVVAGVFLGNEALVRYNLALVAPPLLGLGCVILDLVALGHRSPEEALGAYAVGQWVAVPLLLFGGAARMLGGVRVERQLLASILKFGAVAGLSSAISYLNYRADTFVVEHFEGKDGVGIYGNAVLISESVWQVSGSLALAAYARIGGLDREAAALLTTRVMRHTLVILAAVCIVLFAAADIIVMPFGEEFAATAPALRFLLPGTLLYGLAASFSAYYTYQRGKPWAAAVVASSGLVIDLVLASLLVPRMGVNGAALASSTAYGLAMFGALAVFVRATGLGPARVFRFGREDVGDYRELLGRLRTAVGR